MVKRAFSGISVGHARAAKRRRALGGRPAEIGRGAVTTLAAKVNRLISEQERKNFDVVASNVNMTAGTALIVPLNSIPQGDDSSSRDGRKVSMVSSHMRYSVYTPGMWRVIVLVDKQSNGVACSAADILTAPGNVRSPLTLDFKERFRVIHDNYGSIGKGDFDTQGSAATMHHIPGEYWVKMPEELAQVEFGGIGAVPTSGNLLMLVLFELSGAPTYSNTISYYHRLRYTDS